MASSLTERISALGHTLISRNRKVTHYHWRWGKAVISGLIVATAVVILTSLLWAWSNLQATNLNYQISQAQETQKQYLELNRKLKIELSHLTAISRLERLAGDYQMGPPHPSQVVTLP